MELSEDAPMGLLMVAVGTLVTVLGVRALFEPGDRFALRVVTVGAALVIVLLGLGVLFPWQLEPD